MGKPEELIHSKARRSLKKSGMVQADTGGKDSRKKQEQSSAALSYQVWL